MDNNSKIENLSVTGINSSITELPSIIEHNYKSFVPKIRIRLRPNSEQMKNNCLSNVYDASIDQSECGNISTTKLTKNDYINANQETKCYKILEDSGGGGDIMSTSKEIKHSYMIHGINLRARLPKPSTISKKLKKKENEIVDDKRKIAYQTENQTLIKSHCVKNPYKSYMLNSSKNHRRKEQSNRKSISKVRNEVLGNINLKDIINQENFLKLSSEIQWQLAKLLPNCDKPKSSDNQSNCHCSDTVYTVNEHQKFNPNVNFNALNNEFIVKALTKYAMKMGQSDLINLFTSERENLRSRPVSILNEEPALIESTDNNIKIEETDCPTEKNDNIKHPDDIKSNSSVYSTETMEMNGTGNLFENISLKIEQNQNTETKYDETCDMNYFNEIRSNHCDINEGSSSNDKNSMADSQCDKVNVLEINTDSIEEKSLSLVDCSLSSNRYHELNASCKDLTQNLSIDTTNVNNELNSSEIFDDKRRKRGRKRKCINIPEDILIVPVKRSNRSTAGKRPARLDSESPPISPNHNPIIDKKTIHTKLKKQKEYNRNNRRNKTKHENSSDELEGILKIEAKIKKRSLYHDATNFSRNCPSSPESLPTEGDLSPLSKPSPNGSSLLSSFCRSSIVSQYNDKKTSSHVNSAQALSPSWSCTSESTTPSVKSDYGHTQPAKTSPTLNNSVQGNIDLKSSVESETKSIQGMPPPRQTLTLAAMREKMRAKKLAKEDNRKDITSISKKSSSVNNSKNKKQNTECLSLLKEGDDDIMVDKMMNNSEEIDELLNHSQESLLEFFMGDDNYDFDAAVDPCSTISTSIQKPYNTKKAISKQKSFTEDLVCKEVAACNYTKIHSDKENSNIVRRDNNHQSKVTGNKSSPVTSSNDSTQLGKSIADTIATVLQKLNCSKENGVVVNNFATKNSVPNAYLVDGNGLSTALSIIQSLNPGAKVTTQQFYLVNSGPQLILQPSPPTSTTTTGNTTIISHNSDKLSPVPTNNKVSLAPKLIRQQTNDGFSAQLSHNQLSAFNHIHRDKLSPINIAPESSLRNNNCLKMAISSCESKNTFSIMSPMANHSLSSSSSINQSNSLHLQTISTPHPIGLVHSSAALTSQQPQHQHVSSSLPSLFSPQLRFVHPSSLTNHSGSNTISLIPTANNSPNNNQSPKLLFLCPTVGPTSQPNLVASSNLLNQPDQKYLLLSKQPDKQATIQLVSSQTLWQQLNPTLISQAANNLVLMQSPPSIATFDSSLLCANQPQTQSLSSSHTVSLGSSLDASTSSSSLIIDSRSLDHELLSSSSSSMINHVVKQSSTLSHFFGYEDPGTSLSITMDSNVGNHHSQDISQA